MKEKHCYNCTYVREMEGKLVCRTVTGSMADLPDVFCCKRYEEAKNRTPSTQAQIDSAIKDNPSTYGAKFKILDEVCVEGVDEIGKVVKIRPDEKYRFCYFVRHPDGRGEWAVERVMSLYEQPRTKPDPINHPSHYNDYDVECIEMMRRIWGDEQVAIFCKLNAFKYRMRLGHKDAIDQDLAKEQWYINKLNELKKDVTSKER